MDGIVPGVRTDHVEHPGVVVAYRTDMELLYPSGIRIHDSLVEQERAAELLELLLVRCDAHQYFLEYEFDLDLLVVRRIEVLKAMVGKLATVGREIVMTLL